MGKSNILLRKIVCIPIQCYQFFIGPLIKPRCRFYPSCSNYMKSAIMECGAVKGILIGCLRVLRCNPWSAGGYDPVPLNKKHKLLSKLSLDEKKSKK